jgi:hypothetical protein
MAMILYFVIPGRTEGANPESRNTFAFVWIPGSAQARRPEMTKVNSPNSA